MIKYQMGDNEVFTVTFAGSILFDSIMNYLSDFHKIDYLPEEFSLLYDFTNAKFDLDPVKIRILSVKAAEVTKKYEYIRTAFVVAGPMVTAYTMLFSLMIPNDNSSREIFSTLSAAKDWLLGNR